ncbi:MAG: hypothetical protein ACXAAO_12740 [Candidatus Thorarchaeota archaeon]|jgi:hypothetical protein
MQTESDTIILNIVCPDPNCKTQKEITVPLSTLTQSESGIVTISISKNLVCSHGFQVFVDKEGRIRGYKKPDFEISFTPDEEHEERGGAAQYQEQDKVLSGVQVILGEEMLLKTIRSAMCNLPIYTITDIPSIRAMMESFRRVLKPYINEFIICSLQEYNRDHRARLSLPGYDNAFVIAIDQHIIINQVYDEKYSGKHFAFEMSMLNLIDLDQSNELTTRELHVLFEQTIEASSTLKDEFLQKKISRSLL